MHPLASQGEHGRRVASCETQLLGAAHMRDRLDGRIVLALTANRNYALDGVRPGARLATVAERLALGAPFRWGRNTWYLVHGRRANGVIKVRRGVILEVGIANRALTDHRVAEQQLLRSF